MTRYDAIFCVFLVLVVFSFCCIFVCTSCTILIIIIIYGAIEKKTENYQCSTRNETKNLIKYKNKQKKTNEHESDNKILCPVMCEGREKQKRTVLIKQQLQLSTYTPWAIKKRATFIFTQFIYESKSERIIEIGPHLPKLS